MSRARTVAEGWVPIRHGIASSYNRGCRCDDCTARHRERLATYLSRRRALRVLVDGRLVAPLPAEKHGKVSTYVNHACRCVPCVAAGVERNARNRVRRAERVA